MEEEKAARAREREAQDEREVLRAIGDPAMGVIKPSKASKPLRPSADIRAKVAGESTAGMAAAALDRLAAAERGFSRCANKLKGTVVHE